MKRALVLIDLQNDYFENGSHTLHQPDVAVKNAQKVLEYARDNQIPVIHVQHIATNEGADFFLPETAGAAIHKAVQPQAEEKVILKHYPNSFRETGLQDYLKNISISELILCGMMTDVCVAATVRAAMDLGYTTTILGDACATEDRELYGEKVAAETVHEACLAGLTALGNLYATVKTTQDFLKG